MHTYLMIALFDHHGGLIFLVRIDDRLSKDAVLGIGSFKQWESTRLW